MTTLKWNASGFSTLACITGFKAPDNNDPSGMWVHRELGSFHDSVMPAVVLEYVNYKKWLRSTDPTEYTLQSVRANLESIGSGIETILQKEQDPEKLKIFHEVLEIIEKAHAKVESII